MWHKSLSPLLSDVGDADEVVTGKITIPQTPTFTRWGGGGGSEGVALEGGASQPGLEMDC